MSVCDEGWEPKDANPKWQYDCPALSWSEWGNDFLCGFDVFTDNILPDSCPRAAILKALPSASEEVRRITEALLRGYGDVQFYTSPGYRKTVFTWTEREKGGE